ncbi:uncharacterized protein LOC106065659 [Biomphalaria glabrata]|uniref:Uncharacterized protein LOC106065659 n=1 Tax=Biomphalaria glabrata TaxID=6526 RepID=A0A9W2YWC7_BIOGL|nr:uncharacterized protein LOC106065659 [Biomphalaria glabrata]
MVHNSSLKGALLAYLSYLIFLHKGNVTAVNGVTLQAFSELDSVTSCRKGLITLLDKMVYKTRINLAVFNDTLRSVAYEVKKSSSAFFKKICFLKVPLMCRDVYSDRECYCVSTNVRHLYLFVLNATADDIYSRGQLRVLAMLKNLSVLHSDSITMPSIYDPSQVWSSLTINNVLMNENECRANVSGSKVVIQYKCEIDWPSPCNLEVLDGSSNRSIAHGSDVLLFSKPFGEDTNLTWRFKKRFCQGTPDHETLCSIYLEYKEDAAESSSIKTIVSISISLVVILILATTLIILICWKRRRRYKLTQKVASNDRETTENMDLKADS